MKESKEPWFVDVFEDVCSDFASVSKTIRL